MKMKEWPKDSQEIKKRAQQMSWLEFAAMEEKEKIVFLNNSQTGNPFHVLFSQQFSRASLELLCRVADQARKINKNKLKSKKVCIINTTVISGELKLLRCSA